MWTSHKHSARPWALQPSPPSMSGSWMAIMGLGSPPMVEHGCRSVASFNERKRSYAVGVTLIANRGGDFVCPHPLLRWFVSLEPCDAKPHKRGVDIPVGMETPSARTRALAS